MFVGAVVSSKDKTVDGVRALVVRENRSRTCATCVGGLSVSVEPNARNQDQSSQYECVGPTRSGSFSTCH